jgi:hypothetical protein
VSFSEAQDVFDRVCNYEIEHRHAIRVQDALLAAVRAARDLAGPDLAYDYVAVCYWEMRKQIEPAEAVKRPIHPALRRMVLERDGYRCRWCGASEDLAVDHMYVPEVYGGVALMDNLQVLCRPCNSRKGAR